jgi:hypothetical protein
MAECSKMNWQQIKGYRSRVMGNPVITALMVYLIGYILFSFNPNTPELLEKIVTIMNK